MNRIELTCNASGWSATFFGALGINAMSVFNTRTMPLPFTAQCDERTVLQATQGNNPGVLVTVKRPLGPGLN